MTVGNARVPFLDFQSFATDEAESPPPDLRSAPAMRSPFLSVYELDGREDESSFDDPLREAYATLVNELHEEEFDEALFEVRAHARAMHDAQLAAGAARADADRVVTQHFSQLIRESEAMVDAMAREFGTREEAGIVEQEIEAFVEGYVPTGLDPEFENLFGKLAGKLGRFVKSAAGTAWRGIKRSPSARFSPLFVRCSGRSSTACSSRPSAGCPSRSGRPRSSSRKGSGWRVRRRRPRPAPPRRSMPRWRRRRSRPTLRPFRTPLARAMRACSRNSTSSWPAPCSRRTRPR